MSEFPATSAAAAHLHPTPELEPESSPRAIEAPPERPRSTPPIGRLIGPPPTSRRQRMIVDGAARVIAREGFHRTSVAQILVAAGVSRSTFYRYFTNVNDVLHAVKEQGSAFLVDAVEDAIDETDDVPRRLRAAIDAYLEAVADRPDYAHVLYREPDVDAPTGESFRDATTRRFVMLLQANIAAAVDAGLRVKSHDEITLRGLVYGVEGVAVEYLTNEREDELYDAAPSLFDLLYTTLGGS